MMSKKPSLTTEPAEPTHRCLGVSVTYRISVGCTCGWRSTEYAGVGAQKKARADWKEHAAKHTVTPQGAPNRPSKARRRSEA